MSSYFAAYRRRYTLMIVVVVTVFAGSSSGEERLVVDLNKGIALALEKNELVLIGRAEQMRTLQQVREARAAGLPQFDATVNYNRSWLLPTFVFGGNSVKIGSENNITSALSLRQMLYSGGRISASTAAARSQAAAATEGLRLTRQQVVAQVEMSYCDLLVAGELAEVATMALERARANWVQIQARRRAGRVSAFDELSAEVQVSSMRADSIRAHNDRSLAELAFKDAVGIDLDRNMEIAGTFREDSSLDLTDLNQLIEIALSERPELAQVEYLLHMQERSVVAERAAARPTLEFIASGQSQFQSDKLDVADQEWRKSWGTGLLLEVPIFDGMRTRARVAQARAGVERASYEQALLKRQIRLEVERAWRTWREVGARMGAQEDAVRQAQKGLQVTEARYGSGVGTQLEILSAQLALVEARTGLAQARRERAMSLMLVELAVGRLGEETAD